MIARTTLAQKLLVFLKRQPMACLLVVCCALVHFCLLKQKLNSPHAFDVTVSYVPAAKFILEKGWLTYLNDPFSLRISPLSALWMALNGADADQARLVHCGLSAATVILLALIARVLAGPIAMVGAAALWAFSPTVAQFAPHALTEAPFAFLLAAWLFSVLFFLAQSSPRALWLSFALGGLAILMRPLPLYPLLLVGFGSLVLRFFNRSHSTVWTRASKACFAALVLPGLMMGFNLAKHHVFALSNGSGSALYLGLHPLTAGVEADLLKFFPDVNAVAGLDHLSIEGDRKLRRAAMEFGAQRSAREWFDLLRYKAKLLLFFDPIDLRDRPVDRAWRFGVLSLAAIGIWRFRREPSAWIIAALGTLTSLQLLPLLNTPRYSVSAMEPYVVVLAALGLSALVDGIRLSIARDQKQLIVRVASDVHILKFRFALLLLALVGLGFIVTAGANSAKRAPTSIAPGLHTKFNPRDTVTYMPEPLITLVDGGLTQSDGTIRGVEPVFAANYAVNLPIDITEKLSEINAFWMFEFVAQGAAKKPCNTFSLTYVPGFNAKTAMRTEPFAIERQGRSERVIISATQGRSNASPARSGQLRVLAYCPVGSSFRLRNLSLEISRIAASSRALTQARP